MTWSLTLWLKSSVRFLGDRNSQQLLVTPMNDLVQWSSNKTSGPVPFTWMAPQMTAAKRRLAEWTSLDNRSQTNHQNKSHWKKSHHKWFDQQNKSQLHFLMVIADITILSMSCKWQSFSCVKHQWCFLPCILLVNGGERSNRFKVALLKSYIIKLHRFKEKNTNTMRSKIFMNNNKHVITVA